MKSNLNSFIRQIIQELNSGIEGSDWILNDEIEFEVMLHVAEKTKGRFDFKVVGVDGENQNNSSQKVKFKIIHEKRRAINHSAQVRSVSVAFNSILRPLMRLQDDEENKETLPEKNPKTQVD